MLNYAFWAGTNLNQWGIFKVELCTFDVWYKNARCALIPGYHGNWKVFFLKLWSYF